MTSTRSATHYIHRANTTETHAQLLTTLGRQGAKRQAWESRLRGVADDAIFTAAHVVKLPTLAKHLTRFVKDDPDDAAIFFGQNALTTWAKQHWSSVAPFRALLAVNECARNAFGHLVDAHLAESQGTDYLTKLPLIAALPWAAPAWNETATLAAEAIGMSTLFHTPEDATALDAFSFWEGAGFFDPSTTAAQRTRHFSRCLLKAEDVVGRIEGDPIFPASEHPVSLIAMFLMRERETLEHEVVADDPTSRDLHLFLLRNNRLAALTAFGHELTATHGLTTWPLHEK